MELMTLAGTFAGGILTGFIADRIIIKLTGDKETPEQKLERILNGVFGEPVYAGTFTLSEARDWIKARKDKLDAGGKAVVCKVNNKTLSMLGQELEINLDAVKKNYLIIAIVNQDDSEDIRDSLLVRYEKLNVQLEDALSKGKGVLVVEA